MKMKQKILFGKIGHAALLGSLTGILSASLALAQNLSPGVMDVGKMAAAHVSEDNIINYVKASGIAYHLSPDDIIYLNGQGVTANVVALLQSSGPVLAPAPEAGPSAEPPPTPAPPPADASAAPAPEINQAYFQAQLSPYGTWMDLPPYGPVWRPGAAASDPAWRPYCQGGHWVMTDAGWYWQADDPWGAVVFHYGRWMHDEANGWLWVPAFNWAPSWVAWRRTDTAYGWAPLPPQAQFEAGVGLSMGGGVAVSANFDFGLGASAFTFVGCDHLWAHDYGVVMLPGAQVDIAFGASVIQNSYHIEGGRFVTEGFGRADVALRTGQAVEVVNIQKQVTIEHTTVVKNVTDVRNVTIRNNVTNVRNVSNVSSVSNVKNVSNVRDVNNVKNVSNNRNVNNVNNASNTRNVANAKNVNDVANIRNVKNVSEAKNVNNTKNTTVTTRPAAPGTPAAHTATPAGERETAHPETHASSPAATGTTRPGATPNTKAPLVKPKPGTTNTNQPPPK
jgi:hypothetical protein